MLQNDFIFPFNSSFLFPLSAVPSCSLIIIIAGKLVKSLYQGTNGGAHQKPNLARYISHALHYLQVATPLHINFFFTTFCSRTSRFSHCFCFYLLSTVPFITHSVCFALLISACVFVPFPQNYFIYKIFLKTRPHSETKHVLHIH